MKWPKNDRTQWRAKNHLIGWSLQLPWLRVASMSRAAIGVRRRGWQRRMRQGVQRARFAMAIEEMLLRAASPGPHEIIVQRAARSSAQDRNYTGRPFFCNFCAYLHRDAVNDSRNDAFDSLLFDEVAS